MNSNLSVYMNLYQKITNMFLFAKSFPAFFLNKMKFTRLWNRTFVVGRIWNFPYYFSTLTPCNFVTINFSVTQKKMLNLNYKSSFTHTSAYKEVLYFYAISRYIKRKVFCRKFTNNSRLKINLFFIFITSWINSHFRLIC